MRKQFANSAERKAFTDALIINLVEALNHADPKSAPGCYVVRTNRDDEITGFRFGLVDDFAEVWIRYDEYKNRLEVSGCWPRTKLNGTRSNGPIFSPRDCCRPADLAVTPYSEITFDADKPASKMAADILRRFMPGYVATFKLCQESRDNHEAYIASQNDLAANIANALGGDCRADYGNRDAARKNVIDVHGKIPGDVYGHIETSNDTASFVLRSVPAAAAVKLAKFLKTL